MRAVELHTRVNCLVPDAREVLTVSDLANSGFSSIFRVKNTWDGPAANGEELAVSMRRDLQDVLHVRVVSKYAQIPDACFTFRPGDPQYEEWLARFSEYVLSTPAGRPTSG